MRISDWSSDVCSSDLGEHAEVAVSVLFGHVRAGQQRVAALGQHHAAARALDVGAQHVGVDAVAVEEIGFRGPADAAGVAAVGGGDPRGEGGTVGGGGV